MKPTFTFGFQLHPPYALSTSEDSEWPGLDVELVRLFCKYNASYECRFVSTFSLHEAVHNQSIGDEEIFNQVIRGDFDAIVPAQMVDVSSLLLSNGHVTFSNVVRQSAMLFVTRRPTTDVSSLSLFSSLVFHWTVWLLFVVVSLAIAYFVQVSNGAKERCRHKNNFNTIDYAKNAIDIFAFLSGQTDLSKRRSKRAKLLLTSWGMATVVLTGVYSGALWSSLIRHTAKLPFADTNTLAACIDIGRCRLLLSPLDEHHPAVRAIFNESDKAYAPLRQALAKYPVIRKHSKPHEMLSEIVEEKGFYLIIVKPYEMFIKETERNRYCLYAWVHFAIAYNGFAVLKSSTLLKPLNDFIETYRSIGLHQKFWNKYVGLESDCELPQVQTEIESVDVDRFFSCMCILFMGILSSFVLLGVELMTKCFRKINFCLFRMILSIMQH